MKKFFIKARGGEKISIILEKANSQKGLVFIMHGLGAIKEAAYMDAFAKAFFAKAFTVVRFDNRHSVGESEGQYQDVNFSNTAEDLEDVLAWAKGEDWYMEPFFLAGHSMGAGCVMWYSVNHPGKVAGLMTASTVISGAQTLKRFPKHQLMEFAKSGGKSFIRLKFYAEWKWRKFKKDILKYDIVPEAHKIDMPLLMIVGEEDFSTPLEDQMRVYNKAIGQKEIKVIKGAGHTFYDKKSLDQIEESIRKWLDKRIA